MSRSVCVVLAMLVAAVAAGCAPSQPAGRPSVPAGTSAAREAAVSAGSGARVTADLLPLDVGTVWTIAQTGGNSDVPVKFDMKGPWVLESGADWARARNDVVNPESVPGIDRFSGYDYVVRSTDNGIDKYRVHRVDDSWIMLLGSVELKAGQPLATVEPSPVKFWPLDFEVGQQLAVSEDAEYQVRASVLARNTATVPAGTFEDTYLVRFDYTPLSDTGGQPSAYYYLLAPKVGFVALVVPRTGSEATGFSSANFVQVLESAPKAP